MCAGGEGAARLVSRIGINGCVTRAPQVFCDSAWGAVCNSEFDDQDALVSFRQLSSLTGAPDVRSSHPVLTEPIASVPVPPRAAHTRSRACPPHPTARHT